MKTGCNLLKSRIRKECSFHSTQGVWKWPRDALTKPHPLAPGTGTWSCRWTQMSIWDIQAPSPGPSMPLSPALEWLTATVWFFWSPFTCSSCLTNLSCISRWLSQQHFCKLFLMSVFASQLSLWHLSQCNTVFCIDECRICPKSSCLANSTIPNTGQNK